MTNDTTPKDVVITLPLDGSYTITMPKPPEIPYVCKVGPDGRVFVELFGDDDDI
jgi:hypothetical protein